jgi:hypothetical protein
VAFGGVTEFRSEPQTPDRLGCGLRAVFGAVWGLVAHLLTGGDRDFSSSGATVDTTYDLYSAPEYATQATELVAQIPARTSNRLHYSFW